MTLAMTTVVQNADGMVSVTGPGGRAADIGARMQFGTDGGGIDSDGKGALKVSPQAAQAVTGTLQNAQAGNANGTPLAVSGMGVCAFEVTGNGVGTITFQALPIGGTTWVSLPAQQRGTGLIASSATTTGVYLAEIHGMQQVRAVTSGMGSGSFTVNAAAVPGTFYGHIAVAAVYASASATYRSNITAADVLAPPGALTTSLVAGGSLATSAMNSKVLAGNVYGRTTATAGTARTPSGGNLAIRIAIPQVAGATFYDIALSTDVDPKFVARVSEAQRAAGGVVTVAATDTVPATITAGGTPGAIDINVAGTGQQFATTAAQSTALLIPALNTAVDCTGKRQVRFNCTFSRLGDVTSLAATVAPAFYDELDQTWYLGDPKTFSFGGTAGSYNSLKQALVFDVRGAKAHLVLQGLQGTGAALTVNAVTS